MPRAPHVACSDLSRWLAASPLIGGSGSLALPLVFVEFDGKAPQDVDALLRIHARLPAAPILVGLQPAAEGVPPSLLDALSCCLSTQECGPPSVVHVADLAQACAEIEAQVMARPHAAYILASLLRTHEPDARATLMRESVAYSLLQAGGEFAAWLGSRPGKPATMAPTESPLRARREENVLHLTLDDPRRHNALSMRMRDALLEALEVAVADERVEVRISGTGPSFCSGGDLDEFGLASDAVRSHVVRLESSIAWRLHLCARRLNVEVHGACIGAGLELAAFATHLRAHPDTRFRLPELSMGLLPGAGGTYSVTQRIGRWRAAYLMLTGSTIDAATAKSWGLVDEVRA